MNANSFSHKTLKNVSYSSLSFVVSFFVTLLVTPFVVGKLGLEDYGIYIFLGTAASMLGVLDFGSSTACLKYLAEYIGAKNHKKIGSLIYSMNIIYFLIGVAGFLIFLGVGLLFSKINLIFFIVWGLIFVITTSNSIFYLLPSACLRYDVSFKIGTIKLFLLNILFVLVLWGGFGLLGFVLIVLSMEIAFSFVFRFFAKKLVIFSKEFNVFDLEEVKKIFKFGINIFVYSLSNQVLSFFDRLFIPVYLNNVQLSYYSLPGSISGKIQGVGNSLTAVILPTVSTLVGQNNHGLIKEIYIRSLRVLLTFLFSISSVIIIFSFDLLKNWLSFDVAVNSNLILKISALTYFLLAFFGMLNHYLTGFGKIKILSSIYAIMAVVSIIALLILLPIFGINGAAWAYLLGVLPGLYLLYYIEKKILFFPIKERAIFFVKLFAKNLICIIFIYILYSLLFKKLLVNLPITLFFSALSCFIYLAFYKLFNFFEKDDWDLLKRFFFGVVLRKIIGKNING